jgi:phospholipase C
MKKISHIIILMMENRSFDHLLGWLNLKGLDGLYEGQTTPKDPNDLSKGSLPLTRKGYDVSPDDPKHDFDNIALQINDNGMNGFVYDSIISGLNETNPVNMFDETNAPIINTLAKEFAVFDKWFCSIPGPTDPNRAFAMSGTSTGVLTNFNGTLWEQQSYFDYLQKHNRSFSGYYQDDLWALGYFKDLHDPKNSQHIHELDQKFYSDVAEGNLSDFIWLQPRMTTVSETSVPTWQHPDASIREGERLIKQVCCVISCFPLTPLSCPQIYEALRAGPKWNETLFLITYDEHGGFYDHVPPPAGDGVPAPDEAVASNGFSFNQLGVRIPTLAISPWIPAGTVVHESLPGEQPTPTSAFDSTSILATTNKLLGLTDEGAPPLGNRMQWANTFTSLFDHLSSPREDCPLTLPDLPSRSSDEWLIQRTKPLNDHLEAQLLFFCHMNHPEAQENGQCEGRPELMTNQGMASDWIRSELKVFQKKLRASGGRESV